ncbi:hypothetical protein K9B46_24290, partial [Klebsiella aerogenes]|uniref:hypothetical protein n=1 Tax=Klebsiella aerogenes TaxID=548 RepID=UPI001CBCD636
MNQLTQSTTVNLATVPVDVVNVLDISGSMGYCIGTTTTCANSNPGQKLAIAKTALTGFNNLLQT